jgi:hypothetical protein
MMQVPVALTALGKKLTGTAGGYRGVAWVVLTDHGAVDLVKGGEAEIALVRRGSSRVAPWGS